MRAELEELEEDELDEELLLELEERLELDDDGDELLLELEDDGLLELADGLGEPEGEELDGELEPLGPVGLPSPQACPSTPSPARATPPERTRRNSRRSSRRSASG